MVNFSTCDRFDLLSDGVAELKDRPPSGECAPSQYLLEADGA